MLNGILWQRLRWNGCDYTVLEVTDTAIHLRKSGSDWNVTIPRQRVASLIPADASMYGGGVKCWTLQLS